MSVAYILTLMIPLNVVILCLLITLFFAHGANSVEEKEWILNDGEHRFFHLTVSRIRCNPTAGKFLCWLFREHTPASMIKYEFSYYKTNGLWTGGGKPLGGGANNRLCGVCGREITLGSKGIHILVKGE